MGLSSRRLCAFATGFDFGGRRLALSDSLDLLFAGACSGAALTAHATATGEVRWRLAELQEIQILTRRVLSSTDGTPHFSLTRER